MSRPTDPSVPLSPSKSRTIYTASVYGKVRKTAKASWLNLKQTSKVEVSGIDVGDRKQCCAQGMKNVCAPHRCYLGPIEGGPSVVRVIVEINKSCSESSGHDATGSISSFNSSVQSQWHSHQGLRKACHPVRTCLSMQAPHATTTS